MSLWIVLGLAYCLSIGLVLVFFAGATWHRSDEEDLAEFARSFCLPAASRRALALRSSPGIAPRHSDT